jgi:two-component system, OmpR family, sensor kinase
MFSNSLKINHRLRLTGLLTTFVAISLALAFILTVIIVRNQALDRRYSELASAVKRIADEYAGSATIAQESEDFPNIQFTVFDSQGAVLATTTRRAVNPLTGRFRDEESIYYGIRKGDAVLVGSASWEETEKGLEQLAMTLFILWIPLTLATALVVWFSGGLVLKPVKELISSAKLLSESKSENKLITSDKADFAELTVALNELLDKVRMSGRLQEQFASDAAHELRSPIALIKTRIEILLLKERKPEVYENALRAILKEADQVQTLVESLLASARGINASIEYSNLAPLVQSVAETWLDTGSWQAQDFEITVQEVAGSFTEPELRIVLSNLLDNAVRHSKPGQLIQLNLSSQDTYAILHVRDHGSGIADTDAQFAFERLYRADSDRSRQSGGSGIGLALVRSIVESKEGTITFVKVDHGALVEIRWPIPKD